MASIDGRPVLRDISDMIRNLEAISRELLRGEGKDFSFKVFTLLNQAKEDINRAIHYMRDLK